MRVLRRSLSVATFACCIAMLWANAAPAAIDYNTVGGSYTENFDSLPNSPTNASLGNSPTGWKDDDPTASGSNFSIEGWYLFHETPQTEGGFNGNQGMRIGTGSANTGRFWSFGAASSTERSLGSIGSTTIDDTWYALRLTNNSGVTLDQFTLDYTAEQWRDGAGTSGANSVAQDVTFGYAVTSTPPANISALSVTQVAALGFTSPTFGATTATSLDGNAAANRVVISPTTIQGINWAPGEDLWLRWSDPDHASNDHGLGIDDLTFSANVTPTSTWTGAANTDWNNTSNWIGGVPVSGNIANFDNAGNGNTTVSLGGTKPIGIIRFNSAAAAAYTLGSSSEQFDIDNGGAITVASDVITPQTINAKIYALGTLTVVNNSTDANAELTIGSDVTNNSNLSVGGVGAVTFNGPISGTGSGMNVDGAGTVTFNGAISGAGSLTSSSTGTLAMNAQHTYTGGTSVNTTVQNLIRPSVSSVGAPGSVTSGPFGTAAVTITGALPPIIQPIGSDITIANDFTLNQGFFAATAPALVDPTGPHSLTISGNITNVGSRTLTSNIEGPAQLNLGDTGSTGTLSRTGTNSLTLQSQLAAGSTIVINHQLSGGGLTTIQNGANVHMNGIDNNYTGNTNISGTNNPKLFINGTKTGSGAVNINATTSVGTLGGTGSVAGLITVNGIIAPGLPGGAPATLTATNDVTNGANGRWEIDLSGASADMLAVGGNIDLSAFDFLDISGTGTGSSWVIATYAGSLTGTFDNVTSGYTVDYGTLSNSQITLNATATALHGDFNSDGQVDAGDYVTWRKNDGTNNALANDNGLGTPVGTAHYDLWRANFGNPPGSGSSLGNAPVPEPGTIALLGTALIALAYPRRRCYSSARFWD